MVKALEKARNAHRKAVESLYDGRCTVTEHRKVKDQENHLTGFEEITVLANQPCRLSFERQESAQQSDSAASMAQSIKLFIAPEVTIKPGSKITITQNSVTADYTYSGAPAIYQTHQEIELQLFKEYA